MAAASYRYATRPVSDAAQARHKGTTTRFHTGRRWLQTRFHEQSLQHGVVDLRYSRARGRRRGRGALRKVPHAITHAVCLVNVGREHCIIHGARPVGPAAGLPPPLRLPLPLRRPRKPVVLALAAASRTSLAYTYDTRKHQLELDRVEAS